MEPIVCPMCMRIVTAPIEETVLGKNEMYIQYCHHCYGRDGICIEGIGDTPEEAEDDFRKNLSKHLEE